MPESDRRSRRHNAATLSREPSPSPDALAAAFQHAMIGIAIGTPDGHLRDVNPALLRMLGYERDELHALHIADITHPDDRAEDATQRARLADGKVDAYQREKRYLRKDGSLLWALVTVAALRDDDGRYLGSSAQIQDISAQKTAEAALRENEARLEALVDQLPVVLYSQPWGGSHAVRYVSPQFERQTGLGRDDVPKNFAEMLARSHPEDRAHILAVNEHADRTGETAQAVYRIRGGNGVWVWIDHHSVLTRDERGQPLAWHGSMIDISERKRLEASLRESDLRFRRAFEDAAIGMAIGTPDDICLDANEAYCAIVGRSREELIGHSFQEFTHPDDRQAQSDRNLRIVAGEADSFEVDKRYVRPDGQVVMAHVAISAVRDDAGELLYYVGQIQDITAQNAAEIALRENEDLLRTIVEQAPAAVYRLEAGPAGRFTFTSPRFAALTGLSLDEGETRLGDYFARVHPDDIDTVRNADIEAGKSGESLDVEYRLQSAAGTWNWVHDRAAPSRDAHGRIVAWHGVLLDVTEQKRLEAELQENEARLRLLVEQLPVALFSMGPDPGDRFTYVSPQFGALTGMSPEEIALGQPALVGRIHPDDVGQFGEAVRRADESLEPHQIEYRMRRANGEWVWIQDRATLARDAKGRPLAWNGVLIDISAQRRLEDSLRESEARFRSTFEGAAIGMALSSADGRILLANPALEALLGYGPDELAGIHSDDITFPGDHGNQAMFREQMRSGEIDRYQLEKRFLHNDGRIVWGVLNATAIRDERGVLQTVIGQVEDITARKAAEEALRESEARFRSAFEGAGIGMSLADPHGRFFDANPAFCQFLRYSRDELLKLTYLDITHPDDRDVSLDYTQRLFKDGLAGFSIEKRYVRADGRTVWGHLTITTVSGPDGKPLYEIAQVQDITARKEAEAALRASEARFRSTFEGAGIGMTLVDLRGTFLDANPAFCQFIGCTHDELMRHTSLDITHPDDRFDSEDHIRQLVAGELDRFSIEKRYVRADGSTVWGDLTVTATRSPDGRTRMMIGQVQDITARKEAETARRESEARFQSIFEDAGIGMAIIGANGRVALANPALGRFLGYAPEELIGFQLQEFTFPDDIAAQEVLRQRTRSGEIDAYQMEKRYVRNDGEIVWGLLNVSVIRDEAGFIQSLIGQVQDITARKEAEAALRESEARFRALVQNDPDVIVIIDRTMHITYVSPSLLPALGHVPERFIGDGIEVNVDLIYPEDLEHTLALFDDVNAGQGAVASIEARIMHADESWRWFQFTITNLLDDPGVAGYLLNLRDITERKRAELATVAALKTQQAAIVELERLNRSKSRFLSTISHEFRTPLTAIIGYSEFMLGNAADPALIVEDAAVIHREASRLNRMVDDVLLIDRVDARQMSLSVKPIDPNALVRDVVETFRPLMERHELVLDLDPAVRRVDGDPDRLSQALTNLISNAIKYAPGGGKVTIGTRNADADVLFSVRDEGIGIAPEDLERIFDRFERVETGIAGRIAGTGLGLSIVQEIASLHDGRAWAESQPGSGSIFYLAIPSREGGTPAALGGDGLRP